LFTLLHLIIITREALYSSAVLNRHAILLTHSAHRVALQKQLEEHSAFKTKNGMKLKQQLKK